jgi:hypothetical protein
MTSNGLVIGGIIPAICLGLGTLFVRASLGAGASIPTYLAIVGTTIGALGWLSMAITGHAGWPRRYIGYGVGRLHGRRMEPCNRLHVLRDGHAQDSSVHHRPLHEFELNRGPRGRRDCL